MAPAILTHTTKREATARVTGPVVHLAPRASRHLALAVLKGPAMDDAVRMATEAGMTHLHPVLAERSVATGDRAERWVRIAESAAQQCLRADVPTVHEPASLPDVLERLSGVLHRFVAHPASTDAAHPGAEADAAVLIGPEGGWTDAEVRAAREAGWTPLRLGPWVLRARTAAPVAVAWLTRDDRPPHADGAPTAGDRS